MRLYLSQRTPKNLLIATAPKLLEWWQFYCGILLTVPLVVPTVLRPGRLRYVQIRVLAGFIICATTYESEVGRPTACD